MREGVFQDIFLKVPDVTEKKNLENLSRDGRPWYQTQDLSNVKFYQLSYDLSLISVYAVHSFFFSNNQESFDWKFSVEIFQNIHSL